MCTANACENGDNNIDQKMNVFMAQMSDNENISGQDFGDSSQLTNWILDSGATVSYDTTGLGFYPGLIRRYRKTY